MDRNIIVLHHVNNCLRDDGGYDGGVAIIHCLGPAIKFFDKYTWRIWTYLQKAGK